MTRPQTLLFLILLPLLFLGGCIIQFNRTKPTQNAGIYKSFDAGKTWMPKVAVPALGGQNASIAGVNIVDMVIDPQDPIAIYLTTPSQGLWFTYTGGEAWFQAPTVGRVKINDIQIHPQWKCTLYMLSGSEVFKSYDCSRTWESIYVDPRPGVEMQRIQIDPLEPDRIYVGISTGDLLLSLDGGLSWQTNSRFRGMFKRLMVDPRDSNSIYVLLDRGLWKTIDRGVNWVDLTPKIAPFQRATGLRDFSFDFSRPQTIYTTLGYGIIRSEDGGENWEAVPLITPPGSVPIRGIALNPQNGDEIYYGVGNKIYKSVDRGVNWEIIELPTIATITGLLIDPKNPAILYASLFFTESK